MLGSGRPRELSRWTLWFLATALSCARLEQTPMSRDSSVDTRPDDAEGLDARTQTQGDSGLSGEGQTCRDSAECASGLRCLYWNGGCDQLGICGPPPMMDAIASDRGVCDCAGRWQGNVVTDFPFHHRDFNNSTTCEPSDPDAGIGEIEDGSS